MSAPETIESFFRNRYGWVDVAVVHRKDMDTGQPHSPDGWDVVVRIDGAYMNKKDAAFNAGLFEQRLMNLGLIKTDSDEKRGGSDVSEEFNPGEGWREVDLRGEGHLHAIYQLAQYDRDSGELVRAWAQEEERSRDEYGARPLLGVGVGDDTWPIERATPAQGIDRDAVEAIADLHLSTGAGWQDDGRAGFTAAVSAILATRVPPQGVGLSREEAAFVADTLWSVAGVQRGTRITRTDYAVKARALAARLEASS